MQAIVEKLKSSAAATKPTDIRAAFAADASRFSRFSASLDDLLMDYSKTAVNEEIRSAVEAMVADGYIVEPPQLIRIERE